MEFVNIGLDIGSSAVRAAEVEVKDGNRMLRRYAQVGLPAGAVVDGEVVRPSVVAHALQRLWAEGGFRSTKVVVGISGSRVFVRQAEVPAMAAEDLRSSLRFDAQELVPIAMEEAVLDFSLLGTCDPKPDGGTPTMRVLFVAAHKDTVGATLAALEEAGLSASAVDSAPLALMRAVGAAAGRHPGPGLEVQISMGADLTTVAVQQDGVPRFIRSLSVGGSQLTEAIANNLHLDVLVAERMKRDLGLDSARTPARKAMSSDLRDLAEDVRATIDFFSSQSGDALIERLVITGGAAQTDGLAEAIAGDLPAQIFNPFSLFGADESGLTPEQIEVAAASATTVIGHALWPASQILRLSVLPDEVTAARRARRTVTMAAFSVSALVAVLAMTSVAEVVRVRSAEDQVRTVQQQAGILNGRVAALQTKTAVHDQRAAQAHVVENALQGDVDWVRVVGQLADVMPPGLHLTALSGGVAGSAPTSGASATAAGSTAAGTMSFTVGGAGDSSAAANWLRGLANDGDIDGSWVQGISVTSNGQVSFSSTSKLTPAAQSNRGKAMGQ